MPRKALIVKNKKVAELVEKKLKVMQELERKLGRKPTDEEIAEAIIKSRSSFLLIILALTICPVFLVTLAVLIPEPPRR